ncbi:hypothetical protein M0R45_035918 [Rubus argutus]|uniref:Uncharacterized protein n=1 Tax=Rubus argutus TaxID=59490 RepID=A0AAW1VX42_RUBAR
MVVRRLRRGCPGTAAEELDGVAVCGYGDLRRFGESDLVDFVCLQVTVKAWCSRKRKGKMDDWGFDLQVRSWPRFCGFGFVVLVWRELDQ